jgi:hypothetical protein
VRSLRSPAAAPAVSRLASWLSAAAIGLTMLGGSASGAQRCEEGTPGVEGCVAARALPADAGSAVARDREMPDEQPSPRTLFGLVCVVGGLFLLIGLMPDFDGWGPGDPDDGRKSD